MCLARPGRHPGGLSPGRSRRCDGLGPLLPSACWSVYLTCSSSLPLTVCVSQSPSEWEEAHPRCTVTAEASTDERLWRLQRTLVQGWQTQAGGAARLLVTTAPRRLGGGLRVLWSLEQRYPRLTEAHHLWPLDPGGGSGWSCSGTRPGLGSGTRHCFAETNETIVSTIGSGEKGLSRRMDKEKDPSPMAQQA